MPSRRLGLALFAPALLWLAGAVVPSSATAAPVDAVSSPTAFADLPGWNEDHLAAVLRVFLASCGSPRPSRPARPAPPRLAYACAAARKLGLKASRVTDGAVRAFFEGHFELRRVAGDGFFTGYYEPVVAASLQPTAIFPTPLYARPHDLVDVAPGSRPGLDPSLSAARRLPDGRLVAMPDRAAIQGGALGNEGRPLAYVKSPADLFFIQVQGSARLRLPDGRLRRVAYDGRNGFPYTSIGKVLVQRLNVPPSQMGLTQLRAWIDENGQGPGEAGLKLMQENRSFVFFRFDDKLSPKAGPIGGAGVSLTALRSIAVDRAVWPYGLPFYLETSLPDGRPLRRLMIAQDTGTAIVGPARADIFFGSGDDAAREAGPMRQPGALYVLWPKDEGRDVR